MKNVGKIMQHSDQETLSQLMDGEWHDIDMANCVEGACKDENLRATWTRYHLIRDVIKHESVCGHSDMAARVRESLRDEPTYSNVSSIANGQTVTPIVQPVKPTLGGNRRLGITGFAVAACVALATVVGLNLWQGAPMGNNNGAIQVADSAPVVDASIVRSEGSVAVSSQVAVGVVLPKVEYVANRGSYWVTPEAQRRADTEQRLNMFLSQHIENSPTSNREGMLPYSRLVGYDEITAE